MKHVRQAPYGVDRLGCATPKDPCIDYSCAKRVKELHVLSPALYLVL